MNRVRCDPLMLWVSISARRFVAPMTLVGRTALSVDTRTKRSTWLSRAASKHSSCPEHSCGRPRAGGIPAWARACRRRRGNRVRLEVGENPAHQLPVPDIRQIGMNRRMKATPAAIHLDLIEIVLAEIQQPDGLGMEPADLTDQFGADRSAGAGHQDPIAADESRNPLLVQAHLFAADEVLEGDLPDGIDGDLSLRSTPRCLEASGTSFRFACRVSTIRRISSPRADGMAIRISSYSSGRFQIVNGTRERQCRGSSGPVFLASSRKPNGSMLTTGLSRISRSTFSPASPAPMIRSFFAGCWPGCSESETASRYGWSGPAGCRTVCRRSGGWSSPSQSRKQTAGIR